MAHKSCQLLHTVDEDTWVIKPLHILYDISPLLAPTASWYPQRPHKHADIALCNPDNGIPICKLFWWLRCGSVRYNGPWRSTECRLTIKKLLVLSIYTVRLVYLHFGLYIVWVSDSDSLLSFPSCLPAFFPSSRSSFLSKLIGFTFRL